MNGFCVNESAGEVPNFDNLIFRTVLSSAISEIKGDVRSSGRWVGKG